MSLTSELTIIRPSIHNEAFPPIGMTKPTRYKILYEDDSLIVIDKPSGMLVVPTPKKETNTLTDLINRELDERGVEINAYPCHRIDRETSGLIIYAKGKAMQQAMAEEFRKRSVKKGYIAFVNGIIKKKFDTIASSIYNRNKSRKEDALTRYKLLCSGSAFSVLEVEPLTGRTNQIRIHMKSIGHPLVGETVYAFRRDFKLRFKRVALHAKRLEFTHPVNGIKMVIDSPLAADMESFLGSAGLAALDNASEKIQSQHNNKRYI